jgi:2-hydroxychromene-2-carboxylate isomerase
MKRIDFFFDLSSPYSYMAATQIEKIAETGGAELRWRPMVLSAVFKATGNDMPARIAAKAKYMFRDLEHWAAEYGVPFKFTSRFPVNAITPERLILAGEAQGKAAATARAAFTALWVEDRDISADGELRQIAAAAGLDVERAMTAITSQAVKDQLRANTDEAIAKGAFGAPAIVVTAGETEELFWGNDRLHFVEKLLRQ